MENKAIPTLKEFISEYTDGDIDHLTGPYSLEITKELMQEYAVLFAKYHVRECKEAIKEKAELKYGKDGCLYINPDSIENAYSEDEIK